jgi:putative MATE family efflux protein
MRDWTTGSITRNLFALSWPMVLTEFLYTFGISVDMIWVGRLGQVAMAGIGVAGLFAGFQMMIMTGLSIGTRAVVARFMGAGDIEGANHAAQQAFVISIIYAVIMSAAGVLMAEPVLKLMGFAPGVVASGASYMRIMFGLGSVTVAFWYMGYSIIQASGDALTPMWIIIFYRLLHFPLAYALVLGAWGFPNMGSDGAALANVLSRGVGAVLVLAVLYSGRSRLRLTMRGFRVDFDMMWRMVRIGLPALVMNVQRSASMIFVAKFVAPFGTTAVAAHSVAQRVDMVLVPACMGLGMSSGVLVGQNLGAGQPGRAERSARQAAALAAVLMVVAGIVVALYAESIVRIFSQEGDVVALTSTFLRISATGYILLGPGQVLMQSLAGAGDTIPPMVFSVITAWLIQLPLAYFLPQVGDLGVKGVRWGLVAGVIFQGLAAAAYFQLGRWKGKQV